MANSAAIMGFVVIGWIILSTIWDNRNARQCVIAELPEKMDREQVCDLILKMKQSAGFLYFSYGLLVGLLLGTAVILNMNS